MSNNVQGRGAAPAGVGVASENNDMLRAAAAAQQLLNVARAALEQGSQEEGDRQTNQAAQLPLLVATATEKAALVVFDPSEVIGTARLANTLKSCLFLISSPRAMDLLTSARDKKLFADGRLQMKELLASIPPPPALSTQPPSTPPTASTPPTTPNANAAATNFLPPEANNSHRTESEWARITAPYLSELGKDSCDSIPAFISVARNLIDMVSRATAMPNAYGGTREQQTRMISLIRRLLILQGAAGARDDDRGSMSKGDLLRAARCVRGNVLGSAQLGSTRVSDHSRARGLILHKEPTENIEQWISWLLLGMSDESFRESVRVAVTEIETSGMPKQASLGALATYLRQHINRVQDALRSVFMHPEYERLLAFYSNVDTIYLDNPYRVLATMLGKYPLSENLETIILSDLYATFNEVALSESTRIPVKFTVKHFENEGAILERCAARVLSRLTELGNATAIARNTEYKRRDPSVRVNNVSMRYPGEGDGGNGPRSEGDEPMRDDETAHDDEYARALTKGSPGLELESIDWTALDEEDRAHVFAALGIKRTCDGCGEEGHYLRDCARVKGARDRALEGLTKLIEGLAVADDAVKRRTVEGLMRELGIEMAPRRYERARDARDARRPDGRRRF